MATDLEWTTQKRKLSDLVSHEKNPRKLSPVQREQLRRSITKFNLAEIPAIDTDNTILAGHQRIGILLEDDRGGEEIDVRVPNRPLTIEEREEYLVRSNLNVGDWDPKRLAEEFKAIDLKEWGMSDKMLIDAGMLPRDQKAVDLSDQFEVVVTAKDEAEQEKIYNELVERGLKVRVLTY
jgi:hypothetical protein